MKKQFFGAIICILLSTFSVAAQNPIAEYYNGPEGYPVWVNEVNWTNRITMVNQNSGAANFAEFKAKRDLLYAQGGGVLYYPSGTYAFDIPDLPNGEGLMLKKGVVIVGETPTSDKIAVTGKNTTAGQEDLANHGLNSMPTKFKFTRRLSEFGTTSDSIPKMWNCIGQTKGANETSLGQNSHMGIAWIEMEFGYIYFGMDFSNGWAPTWGYAITTPATYTSYTGGAGKQLNGWDARIPNGTHFMDPFSATKTWGAAVGVVASKIFVFGVKMTNCTPPNYVCNRIKQAKWKQENGGWRFGARIGIDAKNVFVANNVIDFPTACFSYQAPTSAQNTTPAIYKWLIYDYANAIGIDVNKNLVSACANRSLVKQQEGFYEPNVIIRDNWIYNHGNKGIDVAGTWVVVKGNVNYRHHLGLSNAYSYLATDNNKQTHYAFDGWNYSITESSSDLLARFIDYGGRNVWFDDNRWCGTGSKGNDGEGILAQRNNGIEVYSVAITNNKQANLNNGELGYIGPWDTYVVGLFQGWNNIMGSVGANICTDLVTPANGKPNYGQDISNIENYGLDGTTASPVKCGPSTVVNPLLTGPQDWQSGCTTNDPTVPTISKLQYNATTSAVEIEWTDVNNETAYRVDRRKVGTSEWYTIAFRPRTETFKDNTVTLPKPAANTGDGMDASSYPLQVNTLNLRNWSDYTAVNGNYEYRVAAIKCSKDDATYATAAQAINTTSIFSPSVLLVPMSVYPNPIKNSATVSFNLAKGLSASISLVDLNGKTVKEIGTKLTQNAEFSTENISNGMYFLRLTDSKGQSSVTKVMIKK